MGSKRDLTGLVFARLVVLREIPERQKKKILWECRCECGQTTKVVASHLLGGRIRSCGCLHRDWVAEHNRLEMVGSVFGRLTVLEQEPSAKRKSYWRCVCECGSVVVKGAGSLRTGSTKSCGCLRSETTALLKYSHGLCHTRGYKRNYATKREAAKKNRVPKWADLAAIRKIYDACPKGFAVDHIIPLQGELVSGLHVAGNLQYLSKSQNSAKRNKYTPQIIAAGTPPTLPNVYW